MMKLKHLFLALVVGIFISCQNTTENQSDNTVPTDTPQTDLNNSMGNNPEQQAADQSIQTIPVPVGGDAAVQAKPTAPAMKVAGRESSAHYICPKRCAGSGGDAAGKCPVCGSEYLHNDAFHQNEANNKIQPQVNPPQPSAVQIQQPQISPAPQGKPGVMHYVCPDNDGGGADAAGKCGKCGKDLVHNDKFHQQ